MNVAPPAVSTGLTSQNNDFLSFPLFIPRQSGEGKAFEAACFSLGLVPGAEFLLYEVVSTGLLLIEHYI